MQEQPVCRNCGTSVPPDAPEGLCPACVMQAGLSGVSREGGAEPTVAAQELQGGESLTPSEVAEQFPQLEVIELLGRGGMGIVYRARQKQLDRLVALKVLPRHVGRDPSFAERFDREAKALAKLSHPNIVTVHDSGRTADGLYYFVMELIDGPNLREVIRTGELSPPQALTIVPQICDALQYAHDHGVVHRDIKPENILLNKAGRVKIVDFGLAKLLGQPVADDALTRPRQVMGTPRYMAPEQVRTPLTVDHRADIYSLGVVFYEMLTGDLPMGHFPLPSEKVHVDVRLDEVVLKALEREPNRRYQHADDVKTDVESIGTRPAVPGAVPATSVPGRDAPSRIDRAIKRMVFAILIIILLVLVGCPVMLIVPYLAASKSRREPSATRERARTVPALIEQEKNLVLNPGFEEEATPDGRQATYWVAAPATAPAEPPAECYRDTTTKFAGSASVAVVRKTARIASAEAGFMQNIARLPVGERVILKAHLRTADVTGTATVRLQLMDAGGRPLDACSTPAVTGTTDWQEHEAEINVPTGAIGVLALVITGTGTAWFDDVRLLTETGSTFVPNRPEMAAVSSTQVAAGEDLLTNGGFEQLTAGLPQAWNPIGLGVQGLEMKLDTETKHGGHAAATIRNTAADTQQPWNWRQDVLQTSGKGLPIGRTVTLSGWVRTQDMAYGMVGVQVLDVAGQMAAFHTTQNTQPFSGTADWKPFKLRFPIPRGTASIAVLAMSNGGGQVWFDDFSMVVDDGAE